MQSFIVKQPIHNSHAKVWAYEILYTNPEATDEKQANDSEAASVIESFLLDYSSSGEPEDKLPTFVTFTPNLIARNVPLIFSPKSLVIQIDDEIMLSQSAMTAVDTLRMQGYKAAIVGFDFNARSISAMGHVDYLKLNFATDSTSYPSIIDIAHGLGKEIIASNVNTKESYELAHALGADHMQGVYLSEVQPTTVRSASHLPANFFQLIVAVTRNDPDFVEIETIISRDVALTYSLLKLVNSAYFALRNRVSSVRQALTLLGIEQLKQWVYLLSFQSGGDIPSEFIKLSFMRANFCSKLHPHIPEISINRAEAYLMGMLSTLGSLLGTTLEQVLGELDISSEIKSALLTGEGPAGKLYNLVLCYETADWLNLSLYAEELRIPYNMISQVYFECMEMVNNTWRDLMRENN